MADDQQFAIQYPDGSRDMHNFPDRRARCHQFRLRDGSHVTVCRIIIDGRNPPFPPFPPFPPRPPRPPPADRHFCPPRNQRADFCTQEFRPVCGHGVKDGRPFINTYPNPCEACRDRDVVYWQPGRC